MSRYFYFAAILSLAVFLRGLSSTDGFLTKHIAPSTKPRTLPLMQSTAVDKNPYQYAKVKDDDTYDAIVIGSGLGGLSAASMLAQKDKKVLVLEQHYVAGGACHTFTRKGYSFGTGIHYVGDAGELREGQKYNLRTILNTLTGPEDQVEWDQMNHQAETVTLGDPKNRFPITAGSLEAYKQSLVDMFPLEEEAITKFLDLCQQATKAWAPSTVFKVLPYPITRFLIKTRLYRLFDGGFRKYSRLTVSEVLEEITDNKDLRAVLSSNFADFGIEPDRAPLMLAAVVHQYYWNGSFYPRTGPQSLPKKVIKNILDHGGKVFTNANVKKILVNDEKNGKATVKGVEMQDGSTIHADTVVSDVGFHTLSTRLLPPGLLELDYGERSEENDDTKMHPSASGVNLFVGLKGSPRSFNLPNGINWMYPDNDLCGACKRLRGMTLEQAIQELKPRDIPMIVSIPCTTDTEWETRHPNKGVLEILTLVPWHWFEKYDKDFDPSSHKDHGPEYAAAKTKLGKLMWSRVVEVLEHGGATKLPHNLEDVDFYEVATPLTFEHFYAADHGGWYGVEFDKNKLIPENYFLKLRPKIHGVNGLFMTGQDVMVMGIEPAAMSGVMCAASILGHRGNPFAMLETQDDNTNQDDTEEGDDWSVKGVVPAH